MLKARCYRLAPWYLEEIIIMLVIFAPNMDQKLFFSGSKCKISPALGGGTPPPHSVAPLPRSSPRRSAHSDFRTPDPQKCSSYTGLCMIITMHSFKSHHDFCSY